MKKGKDPFTDTMPDGIESTLNRLQMGDSRVVGTILWRHDTESLWASMGFIINVMLSYALKRMLNQERPLSTLRSDPGMPSSSWPSLQFFQRPRPTEEEEDHQHRNVADPRRPTPGRRPPRRPSTQLRASLQVSNFLNSSFSSSFELHCRH